MYYSGDSDEDMDGDHNDNHRSDDDDDDEEEDDIEKLDKPAKSSQDAESEAKFQDITDGLKELDMDHYDDEDDGIFYFLQFSISP